MTAGMKKFLGLCVIAALGYLAYVRFVQRPPTEGARELRRISGAFEAAAGRYGAANRMLGTGGLDTTADLQDAVAAVESLKKELTDLLRRLGDAPRDERTLSQARDLESRMERFLADKK